MGIKMTIEKIICNESEIRLDKFLNDKLEISRKRLKELIEIGLVMVNGKKVKPSYRLRLLDEIEIHVPEDKDMDLEKEDISLDIVYEDEDIIVVNKERGMMVHPASGIYTGTLLNALLHHCTDLKAINGVKKPGLVHRLDRNTSGCIVVAKNENSSQILSKQIVEKTCYREYLALVHGRIKKDEGKISLALAEDGKKKMKVSEKNGKEAVTNYKVIERFSEFTLVSCSLENGRKHQIRCHLAATGHPLLGDDKYGGASGSFDIKGQILHASRLILIHPSSKKMMKFKAEIPLYFNNILRELSKKI